MDCPGAGIVLLIAAVVVEHRAQDPLIPLDLFANRTVVLVVIASVAVGIAMFGTTVFLTQYMQLARDCSPTESGLLTTPLVFGLFGSSTTSGGLIARTSASCSSAPLLLTVGLALWAPLTRAPASCRSAPS